MLFFPREHFLGKSWCFQNTMEQDGSHSSRCFLQWNSPCLVCWTVHEGTSKMFFYNIILQGGGFPPLLACEWLVPGRQGWKQCCAWCNIFSFLLLLSFLLKSLHFSHNISLAECRRDSRNGKDGPGENPEALHVLTTPRIFKIIEVNLDNLS